MLCVDSKAIPGSHVLGAEFRQKAMGKILIQKERSQQQTMGQAPRI